MRLDTMTAYRVIETLHNAAGERIGSECYEEYATEAEANAAVERNYREMGHPDTKGNTATWHVEAPPKSGRA